MFHFTKKRALVAGVVASLAIGTVAFAFFTNTGSGTGSATVGTSSATEITQTNSLAAFYPTTSQDVKVTVKNPGSGSQFVGDVKLASITADAAHGECDTSVSGTNAAFTMADIPVQATLAAGATSAEKTGSLKMNDTGVSQNNCQGATLTLNFTSN